MSAVKLAEQPATWPDNDLIQRLSGENLALQSLLYGLCMGLAQMSDVHREVVAQAFEYANAAPRADFPNVGGQGSEIRELAFRNSLGGLKEAVFSRFRRT